MFSVRPIKSFREAAYAAVASAALLASGYAYRGQPTEPAQTPDGSTTDRFPIEKIQKGVVYVYDDIPARKKGFDGTGFAIQPDVPTGPDNYIVTACHLVSERGQKVYVQLPNGKAMPASVIGCDKKIDTAVLKIPQSSLAPLEWGDLKAVRQGDPVYSYGNPAGIRNTLTKGIVSALRHCVDCYLGAIQSDVTTNHGNSGGPFFNANGQVLGLVSFFIWHNTGLNFMVNTPVIRKAADDMILYGRVNEGVVGVTITDSVIKQFNIDQLDNHNGALVISVSAGSAAELAGIKKGDVITRFNDSAVTDEGDFAYYAYLTPPGDPCRLTIMRGGRSMNLGLVMGELPSPVHKKKVAKGLHRHHS